MLSFLGQISRKQKSFHIYFLKERLKSFVKQANIILLDLNVDFCALFFISHTLCSELCGVLGLMPSAGCKGQGSHGVIPGHG